MGEFESKVVAVTGGGTGIGRAVAEAFLARGASVVINGRRADVLEATAQALDSTGRRVATFAGDISKNRTATQLVETATRRFGGLDVLVNNAGIFRPLPFMDHGEGDLAAYVDVVLKGTFYASQAAVPALRKRDGGAIVNVGSMWALQAVGATPSAAYSAAKAGVHALTRNLAIELARDRIRVNAVAPAVVATPVYEAFLPKDQVAGVLASFDAFHPLGRHGQATDVVGAIVFLAGEGAGWITGAILPVDGGVMAGHAAA
jgi:NAD(P)-dependent dehydrogenase (short-subunit alcohol dehydrogenase family)